MEKVTLHTYQTIENQDKIDLCSAWHIAITCAANDASNFIDLYYKEYR